MRALYISHNGMLEPLGQSQVLPYLRGLTRRGIEFDLVSYEMADAETDAIESLRETLHREGIRWRPLRRARDPRLQVKVLEATRGALDALATAVRRRPTIIHGRGYLPTAVADVVATALPGARLLFDCRGMLGDEYVDAGYWTVDRPEYKILKRYEARALRRAEGVVVLTKALSDWMKQSGLLGRATQLETIPCCVDFDRFHFDASERTRLRQELGVEDRLVLVYSGSLGGLYREEDLARFAAIVKRRTTRSFAFLILTRSPSEKLVGLLHGAGVTDEEIIVRSVPPRQMASHLSAGDAATAFGKTCFARMGCSPTKVAEYLACGLPTVLNDFGDQADLATQRDATVMVESFDEAALVTAADRLLAMASVPVEERVRIGRRIAEARFGLENIGIARYEALYRSLARK